jgi:hypothetical protein
MGKTYFVSAKDGNDKNLGTQEKPFKSIQAGVNKAAPGDTVQVREGVYAEQLVINKTGAADAPITIIAHPNETPVIDGRNLALKEGARLVMITYSRHVWFAGFEVRNSGGRGIGVDESAHITVQNCHTHTCQSGGIFVVRSSRVTVDGNLIHDCAQKFLNSGQFSLSVALLLQSCEKSTARQNRVYENTGAGIGTSFSREVSIAGNTCYDNRGAQIHLLSVRGVRVSGNLCYHTGRVRYLNLAGRRPAGILKANNRRYQETGVWHSSDVVVDNNIIVGCGYGFYSAEDSGALSQFLMSNNTIVNNVEAGIEVTSDTHHVNATFENNLVASTASRPLVRMRTSRGTMWRNNLWSEHPSEFAYNPANDLVDPKVGLKNIDAPLAPGQVEPTTYALTATSPAINHGRQNAIKTDFWGVKRDGRPDIGAHEFDRTSDDVPDVELPPPGVRVTRGLQALYDFSNGWGSTVADVSGKGDPLNLTIQTTAAVQWMGGGLNVVAPATIVSSQPATKITTACKRSDEITLEAWVKPASDNQWGPARIVSISKNTNERNVTLAQGLREDEPSDLYNVRLRTTTSSANGIPSLTSAEGSLTPDMTHVVFTRQASGRATLYLNGQERAIDNLRGYLSNWDEELKLFLANEAGGERPWLGFYRLVAIYSWALLPEEVVHNFEAGLPADDGLTAVFRVQPGQEFGLAPHTVEFDSSESVSDAGIASYQWDFGDGGKSIEPNPSHVYERTGTFDVSLTITDQQGKTDTVTAVGLITVTDTSLPVIPADYARFVVANVIESRVLGFGIQYPDTRCVLSWNEEPYHVMIYRSIKDLEEEYEVPGTVALIWVDPPEEELE